MDNFVALVVVLCVTTALIVAAAVWSYVRVALYAEYGLMRFSAAILVW
jgi:hypothetical protein